MSVNFLATATEIDLKRFLRDNLDPKMSLVCDVFPQGHRVSFQTEHEQIVASAMGATQLEALRELYLSLVDSAPPWTSPSNRPAPKALEISEPSTDADLEDLDPNHISSVYTDYHNRRSST